MHDFYMDFAVFQASPLPLFPTIYNNNAISLLKADFSFSSFYQESLSTITQAVGKNRLVFVMLKPAQLCPQS